ELEDRDRLVHPAEPRLLLLEYLHDDPRAAPVGTQRLTGVVEVRVGVVAGAHLLHRQVEHLGIEAFAGPALSLLRHARAPGRRRGPSFVAQASPARARSARRAAPARQASPASSRARP